MVIHSKSMVTSLPTFDILPEISDPRDVFNPLNRISDGIRSARDMVVAMVEEGIANPPRISDNASIQELYQITLNPASYWSWAAVVWSLAVAMLTFKAFGRVMYAFVVFFVIVTLSPSYIYLVNEVVGIGDDLTAAMSRIYTSDMSESLDSTGNPILDLLSFGVVVLTGVGTLASFWSADPAFTAMIFLLPLAFSVSAMGPRTRNVFNAFASIALVIALVGRPVAQLAMEIFQFTADIQPGPNAIFVENLITALSFVIAAILQFLLMVVCYVSIKKVQGAIASQVTRMQSDVKTKVMNAVRIKPDTSAAARPAQPMPVIIANPEKEGARDVVKREASSAIVNVGIAGAAGAAGALTRNPKVAATVYKGGKAAATFIHDNKKGERKAAAVRAGSTAAKQYVSNRRGKSKP